MVLSGMRKSVAMHKDSNPDLPVNPAESAEMLAEYDFSHAVRGNPRQILDARRVKINTQTGDRQVVIKTVEVTAVVNSTGEVTLQLPPDISPGEHRITLLIEENSVCQ